MSAITTRTQDNKEALAPTSASPSVVTPAPARLTSMDAYRGFVILFVMWLLRYWMYRRKLFLRI